MPVSPPLWPTHIRMCDPLDSPLENMVTTSGCFGVGGNFTFAAESVRLQHVEFCLVLVRGLLVCSDEHDVSMYRT